MLHSKKYCVRGGLKDEIYIHGQSFHAKYNFSLTVQQLKLVFSQKKK